MLIKRQDSSYEQKTKKIMRLDVIQGKLLVGQLVPGWGD